MSIRTGSTAEKGNVQCRTRSDRLHAPHGQHAAAAKRPLYSIEGTAGLVPLFADHAQTRPVNFIHIPNLPKCDGAIYIVGDSMYPLLKSGDIVLYKQLKDIGDIFWATCTCSIDIDGEEYITVKYIQKSEREGYVKLVSQNPITPTKRWPWTASGPSPWSRPVSG